MGLGLEEGGGLDRALQNVFAVHLHNQWEKFYPAGGWVERLLLNRFQKRLDDMEIRESSHDSLFFYGLLRRVSRDQVDRGCKSGIRRTTLPSFRTWTFSFSKIPELAHRSGAALPSVHQ